MSEIKRISPMLDDFDIGGSISEHNGVTCYPAMRKNTDDRCIIKTVSIPASQDRLDALLLTGAFSDATAALTYFKDLSEQVVDELEILRRLAQLEGFLPYDSWQVSAKSDGIGFDVYMLSPYKMSLRKHCQKHPMTHLAAVNLGLDICTALSVCRRSGYIYADLKPNNIYLTDNQQYRIGDIGFLPMSSLAYVSLPDRYISEYTAPEVQDAFAAVNTTIDTYALGLILYQIYNGGELPVFDRDSDEKLAAPINADYEMAEIILKACDPDPAARWEDPVQMGQALVSYMQRNGANDTPIVPPVIPSLDIAGVAADDIDLSGIDLSNIPDLEGIDLEELEDSQATEAAAEDSDNETVDGAEVADAEANEDALGFIVPTDETAPENNVGDVDYVEITDELSQILTQADELVAHQIPDPVVAPEPIEVKLPEPEIVVNDEPEVVTVDEHPDSEDGVTNEDDTIAPTPVDESAEEVQSDDPADDDMVPEEKKKGKAVIWILNAVLILLILAIIAVGFFYYKNIYLLPIDSVSVTGDETSMVVHVETDIDETLLSVVCSDSHGNQISAPVVNGTATFANLAPDTAYNVQVLVEGFHRLTGDTEASYCTPAQVNVVQFKAVTGLEDGSVILQFTLDNEHTNNWSLAYSAEGEEEVVLELDSNLVHLSGLTVGKEYTFTLIPSDDLYVTGLTQITHVASELIYAQNVTIVSCLDNKMVVEWESPSDSMITEWTVRCYNDAGYNETAITAENTVTFDNIDPAYSYTVDVTAAGMSDSETEYMPADAITITDFVANSTSTDMTVAWTTDKDVPDEGWILMYTVDETGVQYSVVCDDNFAVISPIVPDATYHFTIQRGNGDAVLTRPLTYRTPKAQDFSGYGMVRSSMTFSLCERPSSADWTYKDLSASDYTNTFKVGENISLVGQLHDVYGTAEDTIVALYVFRNVDDQVVCYSNSSAPWNSMWFESYGEFDIQQAPAEPGEYELYVYYNGKLVTVKDVVITE